MMRCKVAMNNERREMTNKPVMGDEEILSRLSNQGAPQGLNLQKERLKTDGLNAVLNELQ